MAPKKPDRLSQRKFAELVGAATSTIQRMCTDGRIPTHPGGAVKMPEGLAAYYAARDASPAVDGKAVALRQGLQEAQVDERRAKASLRELELARQRGELVPVADVIADARAATTEMRVRLASIGQRVAQLLEAECAREGGPRAAIIQVLVEDEINRALTALHGSRFAAAEPADANGGA